MSQNNVSPLLVRSERLTMETTERINCKHPNIILNPNVKDLIAQHKNYTYKGRYVQVSGRLYPHFDYLFAPGSKMDLETMDQCYVTDLDSGEIFPMYFLVPCGHCELCKSTKVEGFAHRCLLESQMYDRAPWFITLTYDDRHLPKKGSTPKHIELFLKKFRSRFDYYGIDYKIRYVAVSEYGSKSKRIHYHILMWNLPKWKYFQLRRYVRKSWNMGFVYVSQVSSNYIVKGTGHKLSKPEKCFEYVAKYIAKDCEVPQGMNPTFCHASNRHGGIGAPFIDTHKDYIRRYKRYSFEFVDRFTMVKHKLVYNKYVCNRLFPSKSMSVPIKFRKAVRMVTRFGHVFKNGSLLLDKFRPVFAHRLHWFEVLPEDWQEMLHTRRLPAWYHCRTCPLMEIALWRFAALMLLKYKEFDFDLSDDLAKKRVYVHSMLMKHRKVSSIRVREREIVRHRLDVQSRELL